MISHDEYKRLKAANDAYESARRIFDPKRYQRGGGYGPSDQEKIAKMAGLSKGPTNEDRSKIEVYEFLNDPPEKYFAYYDKALTKVSNWMGVKLGDIISKGGVYESGFRMVTGRRGRAVNVRIRAINGLMYSGTCYLDAGDYCRFKLLKGQKNPLTRAETIEIEHVARRERIMGEQIQSPGSRGYALGHSDGMRHVMKKYGTYKKNPTFIFNNPSGPANEDSARELELYIDNDADLYRQQYLPIIKNLMLKRRKGIYDREKAVKLFMYLMESGAKKYIREFVQSSTPGSVAPKIDTMFNKNTRLLAARRFRDSFETEAELGNYDRMIGPVSNPRKLNALEQAAFAVGLSVATWTPGDGTTRYRFFKSTGSPYADYHQGDGIYTALGRSDAMRFIDAFRIGRSSRENPAGRYRHERLADPGRFDSRSFRTVSSGGHKVVVGCPRKHFHSGRCSVGMQVQSILHPRERALPNPLLQTVLLANPDLTRFDDKNLKNIFAWLTKYGMGRRFPGMPIGWYQQHQFAAIDVIAALAKAKGIEDLTKVRVANGSVEIRDPRNGKWTLLDTVFNIFKKADDKTRGISNPPVKKVWDTLTRAQKLAALKFSGVDEDYAYVLSGRSWGNIPADTKRGLQRSWADTSRRSTGTTTVRRLAPVGANPLTRKESAQILRGARGDLRLASAFRPGHTRSERSGQAYAKGATVNRFGPRGARRASSRIMRQAQDTVGTTMSSAGMPRARMNPVRIPFREGQRIPIARARAWVEQYGTPELKKAFRDAERLQTKANRRPGFVTWKTLPIGDSKQIEMVTALSHYGDTPDTYYKAPKGSKKGQHLYRHKWGEGGNGKKSVPLLAAASGKALIMPLGGRKVASDWLRH